MNKFMKNNSNFNFLNLRPTHCLCPYCGKWHKYKEGTTTALKNVDPYSVGCKLPVACLEMPSFYSQYCACKISFDTKEGEKED